MSRVLSKVALPEEERSGFSKKRDAIASASNGATLHVYVRNSTPPKRRSFDVPE